MKCYLSSIILPVCVSLNSNHGTQMLRVSDIFPQAVSGSLAAFVGSCAGSLGAASGSVLWFCSWWAAWAALCCWMPFPSVNPWAFWSFMLHKSPVKWINGLFWGRKGICFLTLVDIRWITTSGTQRNFVHFAIFGFPKLYY